MKKETLFVRAGLGLALFVGGPFQLGAFIYLAVTGGDPMSAVLFGLVGVCIALLVATYLAMRILFR